jgi:hypothetical protein
MLDHIGLAVADWNRSKAFYEAALKPLGIGVVAEVTAAETGGDAHAGFGEGNKAFFWIGSGAKPRGGTHVAFTAETRAQVEAFFRPRSPPAEKTTARRASGPIITGTITAPSSSIPTATMSRRSATCRSSEDLRRRGPPPCLQAAMSSRTLNPALAARSTRASRLNF